MFLSPIALNDLMIVSTYLMAVAAVLEFRPSAIT